MDLFEYQAKELFAKHGVPVLRGKIADHARARRERSPTELGGQVVVKAQVKTGGRGKAGGVKLADDAGRGRGEGHRRSSGWTSRATSCTRCWSPRPGTSPASTTSPSCSTAPTAPSWPWRRSRAAWRSRSSPRTSPRRWPGCRSTRSSVSTPPRPPRSSTRPAFPADVATRSPTSSSSLWDVFTAEDATLVEVNPLVKTPDGKVIALDGKVTLDDNAAFRHPDHAAFADTAAADPLEARAKEQATSTTSSSTARSASSATAPAWSCPPSTSWPTPARSTAASSRPTSSTSAAAPRAEVMADGLEIILSDPAVRSVFVNVFGGITVLRRGRQRHRAGVRAARRPG